MTGENEMCSENESRLNDYRRGLNRCLVLEGT